MADRGIGLAVLRRTDGRDGWRGSLPSYHGFCAEAARRRNALIKKMPPSRSYGVRSGDGLTQQTKAPRPSDCGAPPIAGGALSTPEFRLAKGAAVAFSSHSPNPPSSPAGKIRGAALGWGRRFAVHKPRIECETARWMGIMWHR